MNKQFLVQLEYFEIEILGVVQASTKEQAVHNLVLGVLQQDVRNKEYNIGFDLPLYLHNSLIPLEDNVREYISKLEELDISVLVLEINSNTNAIVRYEGLGKYVLEEI